MATRWIEGWRYRGGATELALDYTIAGAGTLAVAELVARRAGCYAATLTDKSVQRAITAGTRVIAGFAFKWTSGAATIFEVKEGAIIHCSLAITAGGVLTAYRGDAGGTSLGTGQTLVAGTVYYLEIDATVDDTVGAFATWVDGTADIALTNQDTRQAGTPDIDAVLWRGPSGGAAFADMYVVDPAASGRATRYGAAIRVDSRLAIAAGSKADFAPNTGSGYQAIDDDGQDGDTTYVQTQNTGARDLFLVTQMNHNPQSAYAVQVNVVAKKVDTTSRSIKPVVRSPSGTVVPGATLALTTSYAATSTVYESGGAYDDSGAWTQQGFNSRQFGYETA